MKKNKSNRNTSREEYREESSKPAVLISIVAVVLVAAPLTLANKKIADEGSRAADVSKFTLLTAKLEEDITAVKTIIAEGVVKETAIRTTVNASSTTLITPEILPTNANDKTANPNEFKDKISGIYYVEGDPIATIGDENYHEGEMVKDTGFKILEIRETEVLFRSPVGEEVVRRIYDYDFHD